MNESAKVVLVFWVGPEIRRLYQEVGVELERYQGNPGYFCRWRRSSSSGAMAL